MLRSSNYTNNKKLTFHEGIKLPIKFSLSHSSLSLCGCPQVNGFDSANLPAPATEDFPAAHLDIYEHHQHDALNQIKDGFVGGGSQREPGEQPSRICWRRSVSADFPSHDGASWRNSAGPWRLSWGTASPPMIGSPSGSGA